MLDWESISNSMPSENDEVAVIDKDGRGFNAVYKDNGFHNGKEVIKAENIMFWKKTCNPFVEEIKKTCYACGRRR